eukprot:Rhum_TRINITY_DN12031_c0_g2::Rhum_TRINITY_DN12031_c0_g2_i1::g.48779::m.48779/K10765/ALKBH1; alkylated DNA repair protein alkB homolog 1
MAEEKPQPGAGNAPVSAVSAVASAPPSTGDTAFRAAERRYKIKPGGVAPDLAGVLRRDACGGDGDDADGGGVAVPLRLPGGVTGAYYLPRLLTAAEELALAGDALCVFPAEEHGHDSNVRRLGKRLRSADGGGGGVLHTPELRWVTLGCAYDWGEKRYTEGVGSMFPAEMKEVAERKYAEARRRVAAAVGGDAEVLPETVDFQTAIVNYYNDKSTLMGHTDTYEHPAVLRNPLLTLSVGRSAVFLVGGLDKDAPPLAVLMQSGDAVLLHGAARSAYHGVPCVLPGTCPSHLTAAFPTLAQHRINFSLRQVFPAAAAAAEGTAGPQEEEEGGDGAAVAPKAEACVGVLTTPPGAKKVCIG